MTGILAVGVALIAGLLMTRVMGRLRLPDVTAYLLAGVLLGPYCLGQLGLDGFGFTDSAAVEQLSFISDVALGFIAFTMGDEFRLSQLRKTGKQATVIGILQALITTVVVDAALLLLHLLLGDTLPVSSAITLGSIAAATAPAATLMVVHQYKAKGTLTDILLPVVALDDAVGLGVFAVSFGIARAMLTGSISLTAIVLEPMLEIVLSLILGGLLGLVLTWLERQFNSNRNRMALIVGFVILTVALSMIELDIGDVHIGFSSLLVCMMLGTVFCNFSPLSAELMEKSDKWTAPLFALFFVLSGAELQLSVFSSGVVVLIGAAYILSRCIGKYVGAYFSASLMKCPKNVRDYLGITLFPQAGVALGMCVTVEKLGTDGSLIRNIILMSVLIYELVGPVLTKIALTKAGDIQPMAPEIANRRAHKLNALRK